MDTLARPVVSFVSENIGRLMREEAQFLAGVSGQVEQLQLKLHLILSLLTDADSRQDQDELIRQWISQSKDLAYDAETVVEIFAFKVASRRGKGIVNFLKRSSCILSECYIRHRVGSEIQSLHSRLSDLAESFRQYGIRDIMEREGPSSGQQQLMRRTYSHAEDDDFVGSENDVKLLAKHLTDKHEVSPYNVVSIFGMGGLGKTTIARKVYYHPDVRNHFDAYAWVCISQQWQTKDILKGILVKIIPKKRKEIMEQWAEDDLVGHLYRIQLSKRCLIVLDDIWSTDAWECMKNAFPTAQRSASKILLTTRNKNVAIHIGPNGFHHEPRLLSHDESWELLGKKALSGRHSHDPSFADIHRFEELGKKMVKCTGGLPLAVVALGGILATKQDLNEWNFVYRNIKSFLGQGENIGQSGELEKILALSYNDLPYQLKPCFLYLSIYPEDWNIETETLYQLWMAEGMVSENHRIGGESMMCVAERYLSELRTRCMIQVSLKTEPGIRKFKSCRLHDLMRDMCLAKARDENFVKIVDYRQENHADLVDANSSRNKCHRMAIFWNEDVSKYVQPDREMMKHVRSLVLRRFGGDDYDGDMERTKFNSFKMLRALTIERLSPDLIDNLRDNICIFLKSWKLEIGNLIHLRYLCLTNSKHFLLPSSLGNLRHLETLDLRGYRSGPVMRNVLCKMKNLRHLYLNYSRSRLPFCGKLRFLGLAKLEILENFDPECCEIKDLCKLSNLQVLKLVRIDEEDECEQIINFISSSQSLKLVNLHVFLCSEKWFALLEKLFCCNLCHLYIRGSLRVLPEYKPHFFQNLVELELQRSHIVTNLMGTLEKLPNLQSLWLRFGAFVGTEIICSQTGFPQLRFLLLDFLPALREWRVENGAMANLSRLVIENCPKLEMIPDGLQFVTKLKELEIRDMPQSFCDRIRRDGAEGEDSQKIMTEHTNVNNPGENNQSASNPDWSTNVPDIRTVKVSNVGLSATEKDIQEFFCFSGDVQYVEMQRETETTQVAYVTYKESQGADTAILLTGASIADLPVSITPVENYQLPPNAVLLNTETKPTPTTESAVKKAEDVVSTMLSKGFTLGKDALDKAKAFDEKHNLRTTASATVALVDSKLGLSEKLSVGTAAVNEKVKEMDERFQVSEKTKSALAVAEQKASVAGSAIMSNRYVLTGASWVTNAYHKVAKAAEDVNQMTKEKVEKAEEERKENIRREQVAMVNEYARIHLDESPVGDVPGNPSNSADSGKSV